MRKVQALGLFVAPPLVIAIALVAVFASGLFAPAAAAATHPTTAVRAHSVPRIHLRDGHGGVNSTSTNWSGYATTGGRYTSVAGSWTQPSASCSSGQTAYSSFWVGIDGDSTNTVEQTGTDADCSSGTPTYYAWYEMYPKFPVNLTKPVAPGDSISASVTTNGSGSFTLTISDSTQHWSVSTQQTSKKARLGSAEWIAEAPSGSGGVLPLANFSKVNFSSCAANGASISANPNVDEIVMQSSGGVVKAQPSGLSGGNAFSVTWKHS